MIIAGSAIFKARNLKRHADKAQKVTLGTAIFDKQGRILVDNEGLIPSTIITDLYPEKVRSLCDADVFSANSIERRRVRDCPSGISLDVPGDEELGLGV